MKLNRTTYIIITIIYIALLAYFSLKSPGGHGGSSAARQMFYNFMHIPAYAGLTFLILRCFGKNNLPVYMSSFIMVTLLSIFLEYLQSFVPGRFASMSDVLLNVVGAMGGLSLYLLNTKRYLINWRP
jgi:VanZ family protein